MYPLPDRAHDLAEQPLPLIEEAAGLYFRSLLLKKSGEIVPQHAHDHRHATLVGSGMARGWAAGTWIGDTGPGQAFEIEVGAEHVFQALAPNTLLICAHDIASADSLEKKGMR